MKKKNEITIRSSAAEYLTFIAATGDDEEAIEVRYEDENIWLTQKMLSTLYNVEINTINYHIKKIYNDSELTEDSTIRKFRIVQKEGSREVARDVVHYNLQMIIALGFKVDNERAIQFRKWANEIVKEYTIKGFAMDDERLKNSGSILTEKYFDELLEKIREIIIEQLQVDESEVTMDTNLMKDLSADSLDAVEIIMAIEDEYGIEIPDEEAEKFQTVRDLVKYVEESK